MTPEEAADRVAIRELIDAYAHCADRRDADGQMALFTADTHFVVYMDARSSEPNMDLHSRAELAPVFDDLNRYTATTHFNGQSTVAISGAAATGQSYCLAHHVSGEGDDRTIMIASIRYEDTFAKLAGTWMFSERRLYVDWTDTRPISP
jgi:ketosteroid isomerase-like protein